MDESLDMANLFVYSFLVFILSWLTDTRSHYKFIAYVGIQPSPLMTVSVLIIYEN